MRDLSEFSLFGNKPTKGSVANGPSQEPEQNVTATPDPVLSPEIVNMESSSLDQLEAYFPSENREPITAPDPALSPEIMNLENLSPDQLEAYFPSENPRPITATVVSNPDAVGPAVTEKPVHAVAPVSERRSKHRALISAPVRVRSIDLTHNGLEDITTTLNVSRLGLLLVTTSAVYYRSMDVMVTFPHSKAPSAIQTEQTGRVVRISELPDGRRSVAIALGVAHQDEEFIRTSGERVHHAETPRAPIQRDPNSVKPLVLALDGDEALRDSLKRYLANEGYDVITVTNAQEAREVLDQCTPSLLIAEIEGEGMPGYDICAHCKATPRLQRMPVMLTTSSAYPSNYANAHSLGAVVCMAKPYRQERLGHVVKLLAPPPNAKEMAAAPRAADPSRRHLATGGPIQAPPSNVNSRFRFGKKL
jgi:CheY-like chemotaxis protein